MVGGYDEMSRPLVSELPRRHLAAALAPRTAPPGNGGEGFTVYEAEWWHFDYKDWRQYPIMNLTFEQLGSDAQQNHP